MLLLLRGLQKKGIDVTLISSPDSTLAAKVAEEGIPVQEIAVRNEADVKGIRQVFQYVNSNDFQILHTHNSHAHGIAVAVALFLPQIKTVVHRRVDFKPGRDLINRIKYRHLPDRYISISKAIKQVLIDAGVPEDRIDVIHSAVTGMQRVEGARQSVIEEFRLPEDAIIVGNVANLSDHKGHTYLIDAARIVCHDLPKIYFLVVGRGELEKSLKAKVNELGLSNRFIFTGFREDIERMISSFDIFTMTSHLEGLCTSILDAMSIGVPVVATKAGGIPEIIQDNENGLLAELKDPISIAERFVTLINSPDLKQKIIANGQATVKDRFSIDRMVGQTIEVYRSLLDHNDG